MDYKILDKVWRKSEGYVTAEDYFIELARTSEKHLYVSVGDTDRGITVMRVDRDEKEYFRLNYNYYIVETDRYGRPHGREVTKKEADALVAKYEKADSDYYSEDE